MHLVAMTVCKIRMTDIFEKVSLESFKFQYYLKPSDYIFVFTNIWGLIMCVLEEFWMIFMCKRQYFHTSFFTFICVTFIIEYDGLRSIYRHWNVDFQRVEVISFKIDPIRDQFRDIEVVLWRFEHLLLYTLKYTGTWGIWGEIFYVRAVPVTILVYVGVGGGCFSLSSSFWVPFLFFSIDGFDHFAASASVFQIALAALFFHIFTWKLQE